MEEKIEMTFEQCSKIWDYQQRLLARRSTYAKARAKRSLSFEEKLNKWCQMGRYIKYKDINFHYENGFGCLAVGNSGIIGATLNNFLTIIKKRYNATTNDIVISID